MPILRNTKNSKMLLIVFALAIVLMFAIGITISLIIPKLFWTIDFDNLSVYELQNAGFYVYILPDQYRVQQGLILKIRMLSFDAHCDPSSMTPNAVNIDYSSGREKTSYSLSILPYDPYLDRTRSGGSVVVEASWIPSHKGIFYSTGNSNVLAVKDTFGMDVVIRSEQQMAKMLQFANKLEYKGSNRTIVSNPWQTSCKIGESK